MLVAGSGEIQLRRLYDNGADDGTTFAPAKFDDSQSNSGAALQRDGRIVVVGSVYHDTSSAMSVTRYTVDGKFDSSFSDDGKLELTPGEIVAGNAALVQPDGKLLVVGVAGDGADFSVTRLLSSGKSDAAFGPGGTASVDFGGAATIVGTGGPDVLLGTRGADVIAGLGGADVIRGLRGDDVICGGSGRDRLVGGRGRDRCLGGAGRDRAVCEIRRSA